jgi:excisionase family DNA binding protein
MVTRLNRSPRPWAVIVAACMTALALWLAASTAAAQSVSDREVLDLDEAAAFLRVEPEVIRALAEAHRIPARLVGEEWRFSHPALLEWLRGEPAAGAVSELPELLNGLDGSKMFPHELMDLTARGIRPGPATPQPRSPSAAMPEATSTPTTVGERPSTPTTEDIALRDRVLLGRGAVTIDFGLAYGRSNHTLFPVIRAEEKDIGVIGTLRYGLANDWQITMRVPATGRSTTTFADATISGANSPAVRTVSQGIAGDASISLLGVGWRETAGRPTLVWSLDSVVPTGAGESGVGGSFVLTKSYDPAVLFAGLNYLYGLHVNPSDSLWSLAKHNFGFQVGYTYAVNETLALNTVFLGTYRNSRSPNGVAIPPASENYALQLGTTLLFAHGLFIEPSVAIGIGGDNPGLTASLNFSRSFRWRSKP